MNTTIYFKTNMYCLLSYRFGLSHIISEIKRVIRSQKGPMAKYYLFILSSICVLFFSIELHENFLFEVFQQICCSYNYKIWRFKKWPAPKVFYFYYKSEFNGFFPFNSWWNPFLHFSNRLILVKLVQGKHLWIWFGRIELCLPKAFNNTAFIDGYSIFYQYEKIFKLSYISNGSSKEQCRDVSVVQKNRYLRKCLLIRV